MQVIDKANGYVFGGLTQSNESIMLTAMRSGTGYHEDVSEVQERWLDNRELYDDWTKREEEERKRGAGAIGVGADRKKDQEKGIKIVERESELGGRWVGGEGR